MKKYFFILIFTFLTNNVSASIKENIIKKLKILKIYHLILNKI